VIGEPFALAPWLNAQDCEIGNLFTVDRAERLARVQTLSDGVLDRIAAIVPVTPVTLACAAIQTFDGDFISHAKLNARIGEMRDVLHELNARVVHREGDVDAIFDRAWRMLAMRRMLVRVGDGYSILEGNRPLVSYYANSISHLLGPFAEGVMERDRLPAVAAGL
jgi:glycerol-3-phosphate O-acyltransferase